MKTATPQLGTPQRHGDHWLVPSASNRFVRYRVRLGDRPSCECADFAFRRRRTHGTCRHIRLVQEYLQEGLVSG
jgi:hypothetical protein